MTLQKPLPAWGSLHPHCELGEGGGAPSPRLLSASVCGLRKAEVIRVPRCGSGETQPLHPVTPPIQSGQATFSQLRCSASAGLGQPWAALPTPAGPRWLPGAGGQQGRLRGADSCRPAGPQCVPVRRTRVHPGRTQHRQQWSPWQPALDARACSEGSKQTRPAPGPKDVIFVHSSSVISFM